MVPLLIYLFICVTHTAFLYGMQCEQHGGFEWSPLLTSLRAGFLWPVLVVLVIWSVQARDEETERRCEAVAQFLFGVRL